MKFFFIWLLLATCLWGKVYRQVQIIFEENPEAQYYEIEWLEKKPKSNQIEGLLEIIYKSPLKKKLEAKYRYFRMRSVKGKNYSGWTKIYDLGPLTEKYTLEEKALEKLQKQEKSPILKTEKSEGNILPKIDSENFSTVEENKKLTEKEAEGETQAKSEKDEMKTLSPSVQKNEDNKNLETEIPEVPLSKTPVDLEKLSGEKPAFYSLNEEKEKEYQGPIPLEEERDYQLKLYRQNKKPYYEAKIIMDFTPPETQVGIYQPVIFDGSKLWISENSPIELIAKDTGSGVRNTFYRIYDKEELAGNFKEYQGSFRLRDLSLRNTEVVWIEFFSTDFAGNQEKPKKASLYADTLAPQLEKIRTNKFGEKEIFFREKNPPIYYVLTSRKGQKILEGQTKNYLQLPKLPEGEYLLEYSDNFGNQNKSVIEFP